MDSFSKCVFVRAGKHTSVHDMHPHSNLNIDPHTPRATHTPRPTHTKTQKTRLNTNTH